MEDEMFTLEYKKNYRKLYLVALSILKDGQFAEDAIQEAAIKAYNNINQLREVSYFSTWFTRIVINECNMILRKNKNRIQMDSLDYIEDKYVSFDETQLNFFQMIGSLKEKERRILSLRYFNQMSLEEISSALDIPLSTVKSRLYRALNRLKKDWGEQYEIR